MANPFDIAVPNALQALMAGNEAYKQTRGYRKEEDLTAARQSAAADMSAGANQQSIIAKLLGAGDLQGITALSSASGANSVYGTPIYGTRPDGSTAIGTFDKAGKFREIQTPGFNPAPGIRTIDTGTGTAVIDSRTGRPIGGAMSAPPGTPGTSVNQGQPAGYIPKDVQGEARQKEVGQQQGKVAGSLPSDIMTAENTVKEVDKLINNPGFNTIFGPVDQFRPSWTMGDSGRNALARFNQLKGKAFLQAYTMLKGGGQITEIEGGKAENAIARLDRAQDEASAREALEDFRDAVREGVEKLKERAGPQGGNTTPPIQGARQAPDGKFYVPDPNRPGKYLQVQ